jgi:hypothetical protein
MNNESITIKKRGAKLRVSARGVAGLNLSMRHARTHASPKELLAAC